MIVSRCGITRSVCIYPIPSREGSSLICNFFPDIFFNTYDSNRTTRKGGDYKMFVTVGAHFMNRGNRG